MRAWVAWICVITVGTSMPISCMRRFSVQVRHLLTSDDPAATVHRHLVVPLFFVNLWAAIVLAAFTTLHVFAVARGATTASIAAMRDRTYDLGLRRN